MSMDIHATQSALMPTMNTYKTLEILKSERAH